MSEIHIETDTAWLKASDSDDVRKAVTIQVDYHEWAAIDLPRLEVLQLRDWINEWLERTPP